MTAVMIICLGLDFIPPSSTFDREIRDVLSLARDTVLRRHSPTYPLRLPIFARCILQKRLAKDQFQADYAMSRLASRPAVKATAAAILLGLLLALVSPHAVTAKVRSAGNNPHVHTDPQMQYTHETHHAETMRTAVFPYRREPGPH